MHATHTQGSASGPRAAPVADADLTIRLIAAIDRLCEEKRIAFTVVMLWPDTRPTWKTLRAYLVTAGIRHIVFHGRKFLPRTRFCKDGHMNRHGHRLLAERLLEKL
jgi:hypothetical protein